MFDTTLFDRNAYDRSVSSTGISASIYGIGKITVNFVIAYTIPLNIIKGSGDLKVGLVMIENHIIPLEGSGDIVISALGLGLPLSFKMEGSGIFDLALSVATPIAMKFSGIGDMASVSDFVYLNLGMGMHGIGDMVCNIIIASMVPEFNLFGFGDMFVTPAMHLPLTILMAGEGDLILRRLSELNENIFELDGINLLPGGTIIIDTDFLDVLINGVHDVTSVTSDSVFFELSPGDNDISIRTDVDGKLDVTAIWQNRWL